MEYGRAGGPLPRHRARRRGLTQVLVPATTPASRSSTMQTVDLSRRFGVVTFDGVNGSGAEAAGRVPGQARTRCRPADAVRAHRSSQRGGRSGAMQSAFDMTVEWAFDRYSFGRPLASYQALKHRFADMMTWLEAATPPVTSPAPPCTANGQRGRADERRQGVHRGVRGRADPGVHAAARRHRRDVRARPPPVPPPTDGQPGAGRDAAGAPAADRRPASQRRNEAAA